MSATGLDPILERLSTAVTAEDMDGALDAMLDLVAVLGGWPSLTEQIREILDTARQEAANG